MSSGIANPPPLPDQQPSPANMPLPPPSPFEKMIEQRLTQTRRQVKNVDIATGMLVLFAGASIYLFAAVLADHWLVSGGFGFWGRFLLWAVLFAAAGAYFVVKLWPAIAYRINPIFAAETIEKSKPSLKNSLINFLLLRGHEREVAPIVYRAMEQRAAADLKQVQVDIAVDRHNILRGGYVLMGVLVIFCLYLILSPKNPIVSAGRILWPWSNSHAPTRVTIVEVQPGDTSAFNGDSIMVSAEVRGLKDGEPVLLHFSTTDGQVIDQTLPMKQAKGHYRYQGQLPPGELGLQQDHTYFLSAGDFHTETYRVEVQIPPSIVIDRLEFHYPPYTGQPDRTVPRQGDIRALEGTEVTIRAEANQPIRDAYIDLNCLGNATSMARMDVKDKTATYRLALHTNPQDPSKPEYESYQIRFTDAKGRENRRPIRYRIEVLPDLQPEITVVQPEQQETTIAADGKLEIHVRASDPDFALRRVAIHAEREGSKLALPPLLDLKPPKEGKIGEFVGQFDFEPSKLELKPGDRVEFSAEADDNKEPAANHTATAKKTIIIAGAEKQQPNANQPHPANRNKRPGEKGDKNDSADKQDNEQSKQPADEDKNTPPEKKQDPGEKNPEKKTGKQDKPQKPEDKQKPNEQNPENQQNNPQEEQGDPGDAAQQNPGGEKPKTGEKNASKTKNGSKNDTQDKNQEAGEEPQEKIDPNAQEGDAFDKILKDIEKEKQKNKPEKQNQQNTENQQNNDKQSGDKQSGDKQSGDKQSGDKQSGDKQSGDKQSGDKQSGDKQSGDKQSGDKQSGDKQSGDKQTGDKQTGDKQTGDKQSGDKKSGDKKSGDKQSGDKQSGDKQSGDQQSGDKQSGDKQSGDKQSGDKQSGDKQSGDKQSGDKQSGNKQSGDKQSGDKQSGDKQSGDKQSGDKQSGDKQSGDKQSGDKQSDDKQSGDKQSGDKQSGDKQSGDKQSGDKQSGDKQSGDKQSGDKQSGDKQSGDKQSGDKQSNDKQSGDKQSGDKQSGDKQSGDKKTGDKQQPKDGATKSDPLDKAGDGTPTNQKDPPPEPQGFNKPNKNMKPGEDATKQDKNPDEAQTTSVSEKQSDSKGEEPGSQSGGGGQGGGQKADKEGKGSAGSHTPANDNGGKPSQEKGPGDVGNTSGQDAKSDQNSGSDSKQKSSGDGTGETQPGGEGDGGKQDNDNSGGKPSPSPQEGNASGTQSSDSPATGGQGMPNVGGNKSAPDVAERSPSAEPGGDAANLDYARKQSELALRHLQDEADKDKSELLDKLGWSKEDAKRFLDRWQQLHRDARESGPKGKEAKRELDDALKSLGLRPRTTQIGSGSTTRDREKDLRNRGTFAPPADWAEQFHEYQRSVPEAKK